MRVNMHQSRQKLFDEKYFQYQCYSYFKRKTSQDDLWKIFAFTVYRNSVNIRIDFNVYAKSCHILPALITLASTATNTPCMVSDVTPYSMVGRMRPTSMFGRHALFSEVLKLYFLKFWQSLYLLQLLKNFSHKMTIRFDISDDFIEKFEKYEISLEMSYTCKWEPAFILPKQTASLCSLQ